MPRNNRILKNTQNAFHKFIEQVHWHRTYIKARLTDLFTFRNGLERFHFNLLSTVKQVCVTYVRCCMWMENSASHVYLSVPDLSNIKRLVLGFRVFYSVLLQTTLRSSAPLSKRSSTTVSVWVNPAAVRRRLTSSTTFCIHGWSSGACYTVLNYGDCVLPSLVHMHWSIFQ